MALKTEGASCVGHSCPVITVGVLSVLQRFMFKCLVPNGGVVLGGQGNFRR